MKKCETKEEFEALVSKTIQDNFHLLVDAVINEKMRQKEESALEERKAQEAAIAKYKECMDALCEELKGKTDEERKRMFATKAYEHYEHQLSPMTSSESLSKEIATLQAMINPLKERIKILEKQYSDALSCEWIKANNVKKSDVEFSYGDEKPWFGEDSNFIKWLEKNSNKPWAEWNGLIYKTEDLLNGKMKSTESVLGKVEHLKD